MHVDTSWCSLLVFFFVVKIYSLTKNISLRRIPRDSAMSAEDEEVISDLTELQVPVVDRCRVVIVVPALSGAVRPCLRHACREDRATRFHMRTADTVAKRQNNKLGDLLF